MHYWPEDAFEKEVTRYAVASAFSSVKSDANFDFRSGYIPATMSEALPVCRNRLINELDHVQENVEVMLHRLNLASAMYLHSFYPPRMSKQIQRLQFIGYGIASNLFVHATDAKTMIPAVYSGIVSGLGTYAMASGVLAEPLGRANKYEVDQLALANALDSNSLHTYLQNVHEPQVAELAQDAVKARSLRAIPRRLGIIAASSTFLLYQ